MLISFAGFNLRLNGTDRNDYSGRVEISFNGVWGTICDSYWSNNDARVVCRQLGFVDGVAEPRGKYGKGSGPSWLYYVRCDGNEKAIWECSNSGWNVTHTSCRAHDYDAGVYCTGKGMLRMYVGFDKIYSGLIESNTTVREGRGNPFRVSKICNPRRGLPSRGCCKS